MYEAELLIWIRGPGLQIAAVIFLLGIVVRIFEAYGTVEEDETQQLDIEE